MRTTPLPSLSKHASPDENMDMEKTDATHDKTGLRMTDEQFDSTKPATAEEAPEETQDETLPSTQEMTPKDEDEETPEEAEVDTQAEKQVQDNVASKEPKEGSDKNPETEAGINESGGVPAEQEKSVQPCEENTPTTPTKKAARREEERVPPAPKKKKSKDMHAQPRSDETTRPVFPCL